MLNVFFGLKDRVIGHVVIKIKPNFQFCANIGSRHIRLESSRYGFSAKRSVVNFVYGPKYAK